MMTPTFSWGAGFHGSETEGGVPFRWMSASGRLGWSATLKTRFLELEVFTPTRDLTQVLTIAVAATVSEHTLVHGWSLVSVEIPPATSAAELRLSHRLPQSHHPGDARELGMRLRMPRIHDDEERHHAVVAAAANAVHNTREMIAGATEMKSTPVSLGIDIHGACNVNPPCVYCDWDSSKSLEKDNITRPFDASTLTGYGELYDQATQLVNCSIGEPFMKRDLAEILDLAEARGQVLEMSSNAQILTEAQLRGLIGRRVHLYVSIDAATAETYVRLRNHRFESVVENVRRIVEAKGGRGRYPLVYLVFMPVRANLHELDDFIHLCAQVGVDQLVMRPLNDDPELKLSWSRGDYTFNYQDELLPLEEKILISGRAHELCRRLDVPFANQLDFGGAAAELFTELFEEGRRQVETTVAAVIPSKEPVAEIDIVPDEAMIPGKPVPEVSEEALDESFWPICTEPWRAFYIIRRGVLPCCYGGRPIAEIDEAAAAWNGVELRTIRAALAKGRFPRYCIRTPSCPIVQKHLGADVLPPKERALAAVYRLWFAVNRLTGGVPRRIWRLVKGRSPEA